MVKNLEMLYEKIVRSWRRKDRMLMMVSTSSMVLLRMGRW